MKRAALLLALMGGLSAAAQALAIDPAALRDGRVMVEPVTSGGLPGKTFVATMLINAPVSKLCAIVSDYTAYPAYMPNTANTVVSDKRPDHTVIDMTLKLPLGKIKKYRLRMDPQHTPQACHLAWKQIPWEGLTPDETIADTTGYWHMTPSPSEPGKTVVEYYVYADPGHVPFGLGWIVDIMSKESLPRTLEALRDRAAQLD
ncbi:hypothetical protein E4K72_20035 [Oxalobacteraceae bacterium OM1]|nr:hypothetical protein E4K72_20035 [Oxalobacteraceae bacterium OM1]